MMRRVNLYKTDLVTSPLGMGCASLGSRYDANYGLRALEDAFDRGVTWFDVAPAYGAGNAELILARFLKHKRAQVQLCTKVGLSAPKMGIAMRLLTPVARPVMAKVKGLRSAVRKSGATTNLHLPLTAELIEKSIARSLARLGTDHVQVYALHSPAAEDVVRDDVLRALERVVARGQAQYIAVAGELDAGIAGAASGRFTIIQLADDPVTLPLNEVRAAGRVGIVSHSIMSIGGAHALLTKKLIANSTLLDQARAEGFGDLPATAASGLLIARAFASNAGGVVLASMFGRGNLTNNAAASELPPEALSRCEAFVARCIGGSEKAESLC
ncbi:aldo/keto reductase [Sphingobium sp. AR-3-1]|uniref:Aldo/keto reductase n=1 Tax=Sphingobium psychrophilum TaxID=2728834 RepID=A0A7X9WZM6_9SPHN|nr:aldo/keto reductase [Sphingobium psychrophilum]NML12852.1 aldo/keto reductase [Sphingobium psychrophilum]